jgi:lysophospholipase L1-like esterase
LAAISADDGAERILELSPVGNGVIHIGAEQPISIIKLRLIVGTLVLQGFVPHYVEKPALYLDTLGIPGATVRGWKALNTEYLKRREHSNSYDLLVLEYGTNEGNDRNLDLDRYAADLRASLKNLRQAYPDSLCVLIGPTDRGVLVKRSSGKKHKYAPAPSKNLLHYAQVHRKLGIIQAAIGKEYSCAFWSWQDAMGGPGGAYLWLRHSPALIARDLTHLSVTGYQLSARKFVGDTRLLNYVRNR